MELTTSWGHVDWRMTRRITVDGAPPLPVLMDRRGTTMRPHLVAATWIADGVDRSGWRLREVTIYGLARGIARRADTPTSATNRYVRISDLPDWAQPLVEQTRPTTPTD